VQKYIGEGARLVRELFELAKSKSPRHYLIDELWMHKGARRMDGATSGDREVQRTSHADPRGDGTAFDARGEVKLIAATNRLDMLDLTCCGRAGSTGSSRFPCPIGRHANRSEDPYLRQ